MAGKSPKVVNNPSKSLGFLHLVQSCCFGQQEIHRFQPRHGGLATRPPVARRPGGRGTSRAYGAWLTHNPWTKEVQTHVGSEISSGMQKIFRALGVNMLPDFDELTLDIRSQSLALNLHLNLRSMGCQITKNRVEIRAEWSTWLVVLTINGKIWKSMGRMKPYNILWKINMFETTNQLLFCVSHGAKVMCPKYVPNLPACGLYHSLPSQRSWLLALCK